MNTHTLMVDLIRVSTANVFSTMLGVDLPPGEAFIENGTPESNDGVVSFIGVAGAWAGTGSISCSPGVACRICSLMLMAESAGVDEDVLDAVAELTNMIVGSVKNDLETHLGPLGLSIPTVVFGKNFKTKSAGTTDWTVVRFPWDGEALTVKMCLSPSEKSHLNCHMMGQTCALDV
ncbi:MAG TPA: chemotaxis protein CheX [Bryobacteraceae bacterium]|nr:chemotaxis protein CheX [Bryobacteraceae bacterium]